MAGSAPPSVQSGEEQDADYLQHIRSEPAYKRNQVFVTWEFFLAILITLWSHRSRWIGEALRWWGRRELNCTSTEPAKEYDNRSIMLTTFPPIIKTADRAVKVNILWHIICTPGWSRLKYDSTVKKKKRPFFFVCFFFFFFFFDVWTNHKWRQVGDGISLDLEPVWYF